VENDSKYKPYLEKPFSLKYILNKYLEAYNNI